MSISVNKHLVVLMSVYLPHSGYADHHVEKTYKTIIDTIKKKKCAKIIGGDFNAELGPGEGVELSAVGHYTLNKVNARGELAMILMEQWKDHMTASEMIIFPLASELRFTWW